MIENVHNFVANKRNVSLKNDGRGSEHQPKEERWNNRLPVKQGAQILA